MKEIIEGLEVALNSYEYDGEKEKAAAIKKIIENIEKESVKEYEAGICYALEYLSDLYDGLDETDIWAEYMKEENN